MQPEQTPRIQPPEGERQSEQLHVCFHCAGELAYPLDW